MSMQRQPNGIEYREPSTSEEILGIFLKDPSTFNENKRKLTPNMFEGYEWLYISMAQLDEENALSFKSVSLLNKEKMLFIAELRDSVPSVARLPKLIKKLKEEHLSAEIKLINKEFSEDQTRDPNEVLSELQSRVNLLSNTEAGELNDADQDVDSFYNWLDEIHEDPSKAFGLMTGIQELDRITTGFHRGDFIVIGARTSIGKSAFQIELALRMALRGYKIAIFSLEMSKRQLYLRMLANLMTIELEVLKTGRLPISMRDRKEQHRQFLKQIYVDDTRGVSADYITDSMRRLKRTRGLDAVMVDYLQDIKENGEQNDNGGSAISRVCRKLRKGSQDCDCVMFGLSQVTRGVEERKDKRPTVSDLAGSTGIETSADGIALLYRDEYYNAETDKKGIMEVNFAKQRNGDTGKIELFYNRKFQQIRPLSAGTY